MSYQQQSDLYRDAGQRGRMEMATRSKGYLYTSDARPDIRALGMGVVAGSLADIDAVIAAVCIQNPEGDITADTPEGDAALESAVITVWPTVAAARYPQPA